MAEILQFRPKANRTGKPGRVSDDGGEVVLFPGVRYERKVDDKAGTETEKGSAADSGTAKQTTR